MNKRVLNLIDNKKYDAYYCSGWFSEEQEKNYNKITSMLKEYGWKLFEPRYDAGTAEGELTLEKAHQLFDADLKGIDDCSILFADISFRDTGGLVEIGYAIAKGIPIVMFDNSDRPKANIMLASATTNFIRNYTELEDFLNGETVLDLGGKELE